MKTGCALHTNSSLLALFATPRGDTNRRGRFSLFTSCVILRGFSVRSLVLVALMITQHRLNLCICCAGAPKFTYHHKQLTWQQAGFECRKDNRELASIHSTGENIEVAALIAAVKTTPTVYAWIGGNDIDNEVLYVVQRCVICCCSFW